MKLEELSSEEFKELVKVIKTIIIPIGSIEAHGPHLPLGTDLFTIYELSYLLAKELKIFLAPPLYYGLCRSTETLPGTISLRGETLKNFLLDLIESFYKQGLRRFILFSGHAGGTHKAYLIDTAETFLKQREDTSFLVADIISLLRDILAELGIPEKDSHAGEWETSLILYFREDLVRDLEKAFEDYPSFPKFQVVKKKETYWSSGIWGNPLKATKEKGEIIAQKFLFKIKILLQEFLEGK